jgi:hypothetical protein
LRCGLRCRRGRRYRRRCRGCAIPSWRCCRTCICTIGIFRCCWRFVRAGMQPRESLIFPAQIPETYS